MSPSSAPVTPDLWTAYYLKRQQPDLRVVVIESEIAGFGASGRNGGWCLGEMAGDKDRLAKRHGRGPVIALMREMFSTVDEVGKVAAAEGHRLSLPEGRDPHLRHQHCPVRDSPELAPTRESRGDSDRRTSAGSGRRSCPSSARVAGSQGALFTPHGAALHPARLARGLARVVEGLGVSIFEQTRAETIEPKTGEDQPRSAQGRCGPEVHRSVHRCNCRDRAGPTSRSIR